MSDQSAAELVVACLEEAGITDAFGMAGHTNVALLDAMIDSGLYQITLSVDSGNVRTLRELHRKPVNLERVPDLIDHLHSRNVLIHGTLVVGMPGETMEEIEEGFRFVEGLPFGVLGSIVLAWGAAALAHLAFGTPEATPSIEQVRLPSAISRSPRTWMSARLPS